MKTALRLTMCLSLMFATLSGHALQIGDRLAPHTLEEVVNRDGSLTIPREGAVYVVEFWATWCGPCRASIPHIDELQVRHRGDNVVIVGVTDEDEGTVSSFLESEHDNLQYAIALDTDDALWEALAEPFGIRGIPHAFVIDGGGHILWSGHPAQGLDTVLAQVTAGSFDVETAVAVAAEQRAAAEHERILSLRVEEYMIRAESNPDSEEAQALARWIHEQADEYPQMCADLAWSLLQEASDGDFGGAGAWMMAAAFSPDGTRVAAGSTDDAVRIWDAASGAAQLVLRGHAGAVLAVAFSPDGSRVLTGSDDRTARIWNAQSGDIERVLEGHTAALNAAAYSPDGARIVTGSEDSTGRVWDARTGTERAVLLGHDDWLRAAAFSPDGSRIVTASDDGTARVWSAETGEEQLVIEAHEDWVRAAAFSPDGARIVTGADDRTARVWDAGDGAELLVLEGHTDWVRGVAFSPDGSRIVTVADDQTARVWDAGDGEELLVLEGHTAQVRGVAYSPDSSRIVTASDDGTARVWDGQSGRQLWALQADGAEPVAAPDPLPVDHFAVELARRSYEASGGSVPDIADTYAFALFVSGQLAEAVELQRAVVEAEPNEGDYLFRLRHYEAALAQP